MSGNSLSQSIAPELPLLRRYARALTGSQNRGDHLVRATLEIILEAPNEFRLDRGARAALYHIFHRIWSTAGNPGLREVLPGGTLPDERAALGSLGALVTLERQVLLLMAMEGFSSSETAFILGLEESEVLDQLKRAQAALNDQIHTDVLIIEDEPIIGLDIRSIVSELGHNVTGIATTLSEAVTLARHNPPGLVLADIQLRDGTSGIDAVNSILSDAQVPVIFITAYPERLLTGLRPEPTFLITKPFLDEAVKVAISQALFFRREARPAA
ncbi:response regulator [Radicibacter daui]|uniref:response regulator n=1 Tax=Radicibacter daui TaxID=3064829 RepID=UPI004046D685